MKERQSEDIAIVFTGDKKVLFFLVVEKVQKLKMSRVQCSKNRMPARFLYRENHQSHRRVIDGVFILGSNGQVQRQFHSFLAVLHWVED